MTAAGVDPSRVHDLLDSERKIYEDTHPRSLELRERARASMPNGVPMAWMASDFDMPVFVTEGSGARFRDVDGHSYVDTNVADMSTFCGYAPAPVVEAVRRRVAAGTQFLLPSEDSLWVAEELARRFGLPKWQFTLAASQANVEAIRIARAATGRETVLLFDGHYHGHFDEGTIELEGGVPAPTGRGIAGPVAGRVRIVQFNDADALRAALEPRDVAIVLTEPVLTNNVVLVQPEPGFHEALRAACTATGTVLAYDETHSHVLGETGCVGAWGLEPDVLTIGKAVAGGVPLGAYGLSAELADEVEIRPGRMPVATGGTLFGNPLSMAAARATLGEVLLPEAYERATALGARLADGIESAVRDAGLAWTTHRFGPRSGNSFTPVAPRNAIEARSADDRLLTRALRLGLANRGVWEAIPGAGPTMSVAATEADVDRYLGAYAELLAGVA